MSFNSAWNRPAHTILQTAHAPVPQQQIQGQVGRYHLRSYSAISAFSGNQETIQKPRSVDRDGLPREQVEDQEVGANQKPRQHVE